MELQTPPFDDWFSLLIELAAKETDLPISTAYKGNWLDYFSSGLTPKEAIDAAKNLK